MEMIIAQIKYFGVSLLYGILLMSAYDFLEVFRFFVRHNKFFRAVEDWFFWLLASVFVFQMVFAMNYGIIRFFFLCSLVGGMWLYRRLVGRHLIRGICAGISILFRPCVWFLVKFDKNKAKKEKKP